MAVIVTRETTQTDGTSPKGSPLTNAEVDTNFINLDDNKVEVSGAIIFQAKAGEALAKGDVVYVSGVSGNEPVVSKADADDASKMPAYGLAEDAASLNAAVNVVTFGTLYDLDTSSFSAGDTVYVSTTAGELTATKPTGESSLIQNVGRVIRPHASAGSIKVGGAGRSNDTPNLNDGNVFIGNGSNQAAARALTTADIASGTFADARIAQSNVTQHQAALSVTESQISDLQTYLTAEADTLDSVTDRGATTTNAVTVGNLTSTGIDDNATSTAVTIDSSQDVTFTSDAKFPDNGKAIFGAGSDLEIYHNATDSVIADVGTGNLKILANDLRINNADSSKSYITGFNGAQVYLYHNGSPKLETTSTGIDVTGTVVADVLTIQGSAQNIAQIETSGTTGSYITFRDADTTAGQRAWLGADADLFKLYSNNSTLNITMKSDGSNNGLTGINNANPSAALDVSGTIRLNGNYPVGTGNTALGDAALDDGSLTGGYNTAIGNSALGENESGNYNTAVGYEAMPLNTTANNNTAVGYQSSHRNTTGAQNVAVGRQALYFNTTGANNTALGDAALFSNTTASNNAAVGREALLSNTTGIQNVAVGNAALDASTAGNYNTALGYGAAGALTTDNYNVAVGFEALGAFTVQGTSGNVAVGGLSQRYATSYYNVSVGYQSLQSATTHSNTAIGHRALLSATSGNGQNTAVGAFSLDALTTGAYNTAVGDNTLTSSTTGSYNTAVGKNALSLATTGHSNNGFGYLSLYSVTTGAYNAAVGPNALEDVTTGSHNVGIGFGAGQTLTTAAGNVHIGSYAGRQSTASYGVAIGYASMYATTTASNLVAVGNGTLYNTTTGSNNTAVGYSAVQYNTTGYSNTAVGYAALTSNTTGANNCALGYSAGDNQTTANYNTHIGYAAGDYATTGGNNTNVGSFAGQQNVTGISNTNLGYNAGGAATGSYNVNVGMNAGDGLAGGVGNINIGYASDVLSSSNNYSIAIGYGAIGKGSNTAFIGGTSGAYNGADVTTWSTTSDRRIKKNIQDNNDGLNKINAIRVRNFEYRTPEEVTEIEEYTHTHTEGTKLGVIAQELAEVWPNAVTENDGGVLSVNASDLTWLLINAVKELSAKVDALEAQLSGE